MQILRTSEAHSNVFSSLRYSRLPLPATRYLLLAMTIRLTQADEEEQFQEAYEEELRFDSADKLDITWKYDARYAQGWRREINLREGIYLQIDQTRSTERVIVDRPEREWPDAILTFLLLGNEQYQKTSTLGETLLAMASGQYALNSSGLVPQITEYFDVQPWSSVVIEIHPSVLRSFATSPGGELPKQLQHLIRPISQEIDERHRKIQPVMATVLHQILRCPYQGMVKRAYLESKIIELTALVLDHEITIQQGGAKKGALKPEQMERVHYAKEILLHDINNPPSLGELAHQVGLNDFLLKQGFHQAFGTTVFGELRSHRLETAKQLLAEQNVNVSQVARQVGYASLPAFTTAFKRKFGLTPKAFQKACR